jgi:hypothetical protein
MITGLYWPQNFYRGVGKWQPGRLITFRSAVRIRPPQPNTQGNNMAIKKADSMKTRTGKPKLGPLNLTQLNTLLDKASKGKDKAKLRNRIAILESRLVK